MLLASPSAPADEPVPGGTLPSRRPEQSAGQRPSASAFDPVGQVFPHRPGVTPIMVLLEQAGKVPTPPGLLNLHHPQRAQRLQRRLEPILPELIQRQLRLRGDAMRFVIGLSRTLARGQAEQSTPFQFEQERAGGHVLELPDGVAPVPLLGNVDGQLGAPPLGLLGHQLANPPELTGADPSPLNQQFVHKHAVIAQEFF